MSFLRHNNNVIYYGVQDIDLQNTLTHAWDK